MEKDGNSRISRGQRVAYAMPWEFPYNRLLPWIHNTTLTGNPSSYRESLSSGRETSIVLLKRKKKSTTEWGGGRFGRITSCGKALQSQRELGHYSSAHSLNRINSSGVLKDNEHANYCLGAREQDEEWLLFSDVLTHAAQVRNVILQESLLVEQRDVNHRWVLPVALQSHESELVCSSRKMLSNQICY